MDMWQEIPSHFWKFITTAYMLQYSQKYGKSKSWCCYQNLTRQLINRTHPLYMIRTIGKMLEKVIFKRMIDHIEKKGLNVV